MPGNSAGGKKAAQTLKAKHGDDFYSVIGRKGGKNGNTGGFFGNREAASKAGYKGGIVTGADYKTRRKDVDIQS